MKISTWNIKHGGSKKKLSQIIKTIIDHDADLIVLTEFRIENGLSIQNGLKKAGWTYQVSSNPPAKTNGILICSKETFQDSQKHYLPSTVNQRWLEIAMPSIYLKVLGIHIPGFNDKWGKEPFWQKVVEYASDMQGEKAIIIGDFNTGLKIDTEGTPFKLSEYMEQLIELGWVDAWRHLNPSKREYTWYSNANNGFRLDYAFLSPNLSGALRSANHSHSERRNIFSDHSSLIVDLDIGP